MSQNLTDISRINDGIVSRYIKPSLMKEGKILNEAFDLRDRTPPEEFVSFYKVEKNEINLMFTYALSFIKMTISPNGLITLFNVEEVLESINDEDDDIIAFSEQSLPHCGLEYLTNNLTKILEAKTTLSYLAQQKYSFIKDIEKDITKLELK